MTVREPPGKRADPVRAFESLRDILAASTGYAMLGLDAASTIRFWNEGARRLYGREASEVVGRETLELLCDPEQLPAAGVPGICEAARRDGQWQGTLPQRGGDGRRFQADVTITPLHPGAGELLLIARGLPDGADHASPCAPADEALRQSEERFRTLVEQAADAFFVHDFDGRFLDVNQRACASLGYTRAELLTMNVLDVELDFNLASAQDAWSRIQPGQGITLAGHQWRKDGTSFPVEARIGCIEMRGQRLYVGLVRDTSERDQAAEAFRESEARYRSLFQNMLGGYAYCRMIYEGSRPIDFVYIEVNAAFGRLTGLKDVVGKRVTEVIPCIRVENPELFEIYGRVACTGQPERFEDYVPALKAWLLISVYSPELDHFVAVFENVTERKRAVQEIQLLNRTLEQRIVERTAELEATNSRLREEIAEREHARSRLTRQAAVLDGMNTLFRGALGAETEEGLAEQALRLAVRLTGSRSGLIADLKGDNTLDALTLDDPGGNPGRVDTEMPIRRRSLPIEGTLARILHHGPLIVNDLAPVELPEPHPHISTLLGVPLEHAGRVSGLIVLGNKPSGYTRADRRDVLVLAGAFIEALIRRRAEERVKELNTDLARRALELEAANKELETFSYSVSHDLRAPLRAVDGFARILEEDHAHRLDPEGLAVLAVVREESRRMGQLIDDLLAFARQNRRPIHSEPVDMTALARAQFDECAARAPGRTLRLTLGELAPALGDAAMIRQVLFNLIANAIKYTRPRSVAEIEIGSRVEGATVVYHVRDNGVGFDMNYVGKLFGIFQRLHSDDEFEGTGVGLALVSNIVSRHGGRVRAEGRVDGGAVFSFTLPAASGATP